MPITLTIGDVTGVTLKVDSGVQEAQDFYGGPSARVTYMCPYNKRYDLGRALMGTSVSVGASITRTLPHQYPPSSNMYCIGIDNIEGIKPKRDETGWMTFEVACVTATYGVPVHQFTDGNPGNGNIDPSGKAWTRTTGNVSAEVVRPPHGTYYYVPSGGQIEDGTFGITIPNLELTLTRVMMPFVPLAQMMFLAGKVNNAPYRIGNQSFARGCLLFAAGPFDSAIDPLAGLVFEVQYKFLARPFEWNKTINKSGDFVLMNTVQDGSGQFPFTYADFTLLP
jgi:hypothetical protein